MRMLRAILITLFAILGTAVNAAPKFVTPAMMKRNGLTDEQYELLWKQGKNPQIDVATARDLIFRASRYQNVTNWLEECGKTNDFAKLSYKLQNENLGLVDENKALVDYNGVLRSDVEKLEAKVETYYAKWTNSYANATNYYAKSERLAGLINSEIERMKQDKADIEGMIDNAEYILLRPWLRLKLAAVEAAIAKLSEGEEGGA